MSQTKTAVVRVIREMIDRGNKDDCFRCPVARGAIAAFPGATGVIASESEISIYFGDEEWWSELPDVARDFIARFDRGDAQLSPIKFPLTLTPIV